MQKEVADTILSVVIGLGIGGGLVKSTEILAEVVTDISHGIKVAIHNARFVRKIKLTDEQWKFALADNQTPYERETFFNSFVKEGYHYIDVKVHKLKPQLVVHFHKKPEDYDQFLENLKRICTPQPTTTRTMTKGEKISAKLKASWAKRKATKKVKVSKRK